MKASSRIWQTIVEYAVKTECSAGWKLTSNLYAPSCRVNQNSSEEHRKCTIHSVTEANMSTPLRFFAFVYVEIKIGCHLSYRLGIHFFSSDTKKHFATRLGVHAQFASKHWLVVVSGTEHEMKIAEMETTVTNCQSTSLLCIDNVYIE